jgi:hypothetical protein
MHLFVIAGKGRYLDDQSAQRIMQIYDMCDDLTPLHLKIEAWHKVNPVPGTLTMDKFKTIIIPRQHVLKTLDLDHIKPSDEFHTILAHMKLQYMDMEGSGGSS